MRLPQNVFNVQLLEFLIPMRGNEVQVFNLSSAAAAIPNPHEG